MTPDGKLNLQEETKSIKNSNGKYVDKYKRLCVYLYSLHFFKNYEVIENNNYNRAVGLKQMQV